MEIGLDYGNEIYIIGNKEARWERMQLNEKKVLKK